MGSRLRQIARRHGDYLWDVGGMCSGMLWEGMIDLGDLAYLYEKMKVLEQYGYPN